MRSSGTDQTLYFHIDHLGSVDLITNAVGTTVAEQQFDAFGAPADADALAPELTRSGFTGHQHDRDLGLIDMKGRVYDPLAGRFMSADPISQAPFWSQGLNRYAYVFNDPINNNDPSGFLETDTQGGLGISGWGAGVVAGAYGSIGGGGLAGSAGLGGISVGGGLLGLASGGLGVAQTQFLGGDIFSGRAARSEAVQVGTAAPTGGASAPGGMQATGQVGGIQEGVKAGAPSWWPRVPTDTSDWVAGSGAGGPGTPYLPNADRKPPGWTPDWPEGVDERGPYSQDPNGNTRYYPHPEDDGHWDHYDYAKGKRYPEDSKKPWPNQKRLGKGMSWSDPWASRFSVLHRGTPPAVALERVTPAVASTITLTTTALLLLAIVLLPVGL